MPDHRHLVPRRRREDASHRDERCVQLAAHPVLVPVWEDDDVSGVGPEPLARRGLDPGPSRGDDVEEDHSLGMGREDRLGVLRGQRFVAPRLAVLATKEYRALEVQPREGEEQWSCGFWVRITG